MYRGSIQIEFCYTLQKNPLLFSQGALHICYLCARHMKLFVEQYVPRFSSICTPLDPLDCTVSNFQQCRLLAQVSSCPQLHVQSAGLHGVCWKGEHEDSLTPACALKYLHTARCHFPQLPWSHLPQSSLHTWHTLAVHASISMENAVG